MTESRIYLELDSTLLSGESALANIKWRQRSFLSLSGTQCLSLFVKKIFSYRVYFIAHFLFFSFSPHWAYVRFSNRTPDYVLATQLALKRIRGCVSVSSLGLVRVAFQDE